MQNEIDKEVMSLYSKEYFIVTSDNGFIHIGKPVRIECPFMGSVLRIFDCSTIRRWGTDNGIGQLAIEGKQEGTILDYDGVKDIAVSRLNHINHIKLTALETYGFIR